MLLTRQNLNNHCPIAIGIYKIRGVNAQGAPIPISRFAGVDYSGLLYIGQTEGQDLQCRLKNFIQTAKLDGNTTNHSGALKYRTRQIIRDTLGVGHQLYFEFEECRSPKEREIQLLNEYVSEFGETPPLNG